MFQSFLFKGIAGGLILVIAQFLAAGQVAAQTIDLPSESTTGTFTITISGGYTWYVQERTETSDWKTIKYGSGYSSSFQLTRGEGIFDYKLHNCYPFSGGCSFGAIKSIHIDLPDPTPAVPSLSVASTADGDGKFTVTPSRPTYTSYFKYKQWVNGSWSSEITRYSSYEFETTQSGVWKFIAKACNSTDACSSYSSSVTVNVAIAPGNTSGLNTPATNDGQYQLSWNAATGSVTRYDLEYRTDTNSNYYDVPGYNGTSTSPTVTMSAGNYRHRVRACKKVGTYENCSAYTYSSGYTTVAKPASTPGVNLPTQSNTGTYDVTWLPISNTRHYKYQEKIGNSWQSEKTTTQTTLSYNSKPNNTYQYKVAACNNIGCTAYSSLQTIDVARKPGVPASLQTPPTNDGDYPISWGASSGDFDKYYLQYELNGNGNWLEGYSGSLTHADIVVNTTGTYRHRVYACKTVGSYKNCSDPRYASATTYVGPPATRPSITLNATDSDGIYSVSWNSISNSNTYTLERNTNGSGWSFVQNATALFKEYNEPTSARFGFHVKACNNRGCTSFSDAKYINVAIKPGVPPEVRAPNTSSGTHTVQWDPSSGTVSYYELIYKNAWESDWKSDSPGANLSDELSGLRSGSYTHKVRACVNISGTIACSDYKASGTTIVKAAMSVGYKYDALGRLVKVDDNAAVRVAYCYDEAGNRSAVTENSEQACPNTQDRPPAPAGLTLSASQAQNGTGYYATWQAVPAAQYYLVSLPAQDSAHSDNPVRIDAPKTNISTNSQRPNIVRACNVYGCGASASFPGN